MSGVSVGVLTLRGPNADVIERMTGVSVTGEWVLWTLTAEWADTVSDPSEESLLSNAPGVNRKEAREGGTRRGLVFWVLRICHVPEPDSVYVLDGDG
jgi:hypothetical protein